MCKTTAVSELPKHKSDGFLARLSPKVRFFVQSLMVLFVVSILAGIANPILYLMFLSDRGVGFFDTPGWGLFWEFHSGPIGGTLIVLEFAPYVIALLALQWVLRGLDEEDEPEQ